MKRCLYCDFYSTTLLSHASRYVDAVVKEYESRKSELSTFDSKRLTIYLGGGTPSLLTPCDLTRLLSALPIHRASEITIEANPGDITPERVSCWRETGINRVSIGIQSLQDSLLQMIGRRHTAAEAMQAVKTVREGGIGNISVDLMYGLPGQTMDMWMADISGILALDVDHISTYCLSYEPGTPLTRMLDSGAITPVDEDMQNAFYDSLVATLKQHGYHHYEISNFALPGRESQHNSGYWNHTPYVGLGAAAHSYDGACTRSWNIADMEAYTSAMWQGKRLFESETLTEEQLRTERVMLGLRTDEGVACTDVNADAAFQLVSGGLLVEKNSRLVATSQGQHILNQLIERLIS